MKILIPIEKLNEYGSRDPIPLECERCFKTFFQPKNVVYRGLKGTRKVGFCSSACSRKKTKKISKCKHCNKNFTSKRGIYCSIRCANLDRGDVPEKQRQKHRIAAFKQHKEIIGHPRTYIGYAQCSHCEKNFVFDKKRPRKTCSQNCLHERMSQLCKSRPNMGKNNNKHAKWYESPIAGRVWLESTWEIKVAEILDKNNIIWERPIKGFEWKDLSGKWHKYYPDFYIKDKNIYLDPKNPWVWTRDLFKINQIISNHKISLFILKKEEITENYILKLVSC